MAQLDVRDDYFGGSAPINTISDKKVIAVNRYFVSAELSGQDAGELFKWVRNSDEAKKANQLQDEFLKKVKMVNTQTRKAKKQAEQRKILRAVKLATSCQLHGGTTHYQQFTSS